MIWSGGGSWESIFTIREKNNWYKTHLLITVSSIVCEVIATVFFFIKHILSYKQKKIFNQDIFKQLSKHLIHLEQKLPVTS